MGSEKKGESQQPDEEQFQVRRGPGPGGDKGQDQGTTQEEEGPEGDLSQPAFGERGRQFPQQGPKSRKEHETIACGFQELLEGKEPVRRREEAFGEREDPEQGKARSKEEDRSKEVGTVQAAIKEQIEEDTGQGGKSQRGARFSEGVQRSPTKDVDRPGKDLNQRDPPKRQPQETMGGGGSPQATDKIGQRDEPHGASPNTAWRSRQSA